MPSPLQKLRCSLSPAESPPNTRSRLVLAGLPALIAILSCASAAPSVGAESSKSSGVKCTLEQVKDTEKSGLVAFTYFVPEGWTTHHFMKWGDSDSFVANISATTPDKSYSVDQLEPMLSTYMAMRGIAPRGVRITHATDFLHSLVDQVKRQYNLESV